MRLATPGFLQPRFRVGLHFFRWGVHLKIRRGVRFRHLAAKIRRVNRYGRVSGRELWLGWWVSDKGERSPFSGLCIGFRVERFGRVKINERMENPLYPNKAQKVRRATTSHGSAVVPKNSPSSPTGGLS